MYGWKEFYRDIKDPQWPDCDREDDFGQLPEWIQRECQDRGYRPGQYQARPSLAGKVFPIKTQTACQLKWSWSSLYLTNGMTSSCHRTHHHEFDIEKFDFHNTPAKLQDRQLMLAGQWPKTSCDYCRHIEEAGGISDRITSLDLPGLHPPPELDANPTATRVTPRMLEVYFNNTCNLKCVYCGPHFSSLWEAENRKQGQFENSGVIWPQHFKKNPQMDLMKSKTLEWLRGNAGTLTHFNFLGGEPLFQAELDEVLDIFQQTPAPDLEFQFFSNLNATPQRVEQVLSRIRDLVDRGHLRSFTITASLDCWGARQEYARFPLKLEVWEKNFEYLVGQKWLRLVVGSTITPLTITTAWQLIERLNRWRQQREIYHYLNSANNPNGYMGIDMFGDLFQESFQKALELMPQDDHHRSISTYLSGIARQSKSRGETPEAITKFYHVLEELDRRRGTNWRETFPELVDAVERNIIDLKNKIVLNNSIQ